MAKPTTYTSYLRLSELLNLQSPKSTPVEHDEMLFIIIHQVYELWFKQLLHELDYACKLLDENQAMQVLHTMTRMRTILKTAVSQIDVMETMTPLEFNSFRAFLESGSGFQSIQFRELEFALGYKRETLLNHYPDDTYRYDRLMARFKAPTLWDHFLRFLKNSNIAIPQQVLERDITKSIESSEDVQTQLVNIYYNRPDLTQVCESLLDFDEGLQEWRFRHVKMVQRTIGTKTGTGGSSGAAYLATTVRPIFEDLWAIRDKL